MSSINEYLTSEVVVDYSEGLINRREALRRLSMLGVGLAVAGALLAACGSPSSSPSPATGSPSGSGSAPAGPSPLPSEAITVPRTRETAKAEERRPESARRKSVDERNDGDAKRERSCMGLKRKRRLARITSPREAALARGD